MRLKRKMGMFFIFACIIPVIVMLFVLLNQNIENIKNVNKKEVEKTISLVNKITKQELEKGFISLDYLENVFSEQDDSYEMFNAIYKISRNSTNFKRVYMFNEITENVEVYPKENVEFKKDSNWYIKARTAKNLVYVQDKNSSEPVVTVSRSIVKEGKIVGIVAVDIDLKMTFSELQNNQENSIIIYKIIDRDTNKVVYPKELMFSKEFIKNTIENTNNFGKSQIYNLNEKKISYYKEIIDGTNWILVGAFDLSDLKTMYSESKNILYISLIMIGILLLLALVMFENVLVEPLIQVKEKFKQASIGNFGTRIFVDSNDEIGDIALEFNTLMKKISKKIKNIDNDASKGLLKENISSDIELDEAINDFGENFEIEQPISMYSNIPKYKKSQESKLTNKSDIKKNSFTEEYNFDNPLVEEDEEFRQHEKDLIHRTFDEWRTEYFKTLEEKKKTIEDNIQ